VEAAGEKWRHAVEVRRQDDLRRIDHRKNVEPASIDWLLADGEAAVPQEPRQPPAGLRFASRRRIDVDERPCELNRIQQLYPLSRCWRGQRSASRTYIPQSHLALLSQPK